MSKQTQSYAVARFEIVATCQGNILTPAAPLFNCHCSIFPTCSSNLLFSMNALHIISHLTALCLVQRSHAGAARYIIGN